MRDNEKLLQALHDINVNLTGIRNLMRHQLERQTAENPTSANKETNKPKEAAPAPKAITWQEAVKTLRNLCQAHRYCADCPAHKWCDRALPPNMSVIAPNGWEVPGDE